jgi:SAM-dependent methyltransferase
MDRNDPAFAGQRDYNELLLGLYDPVVVGPIARWVWRCPSAQIVDNYRATIGAPHLDVGPGTGYFIRHSGLTPGTSVTLLDPNRTVLRHAARRLGAWSVTTVEADVLKPLPDIGPFPSVALNLVLHCLPGPTSRKALAIGNLARMVTPDGVLFGATVLGRSAHHTWLARRFLAAFNAEGSFDNADDTEASIRGILDDAFDSVELWTVGSIALFRARRPRVAAASR